jgi:hypothetical protein
MILFRGGVAEREKSAKSTVSDNVAVCDPLIPLTVKLKGFGVEVLRLLMVRVVLWPGKTGEGLKEHVALEEQLNEMLPVKL